MTDEKDPSKGRNRGMGFWIGNIRGDPKPPPYNEPPVFGKPTSTGDLFRNDFITIQPLLGADVEQPTEALDGLFRTKVIIFPPPEGTTETELTENTA